MSHIYTNDSRMLDPLFRQGYRDMQRFGYYGLEYDMPAAYYDGVAQAASELAEVNTVYLEDLTNIWYTNTVTNQPLE